MADPLLPSPALTISGHAVARYQERVANLPAASARAAMDSPAARLAARIGAPFVRLATGQRLVIRNHAVITVLPAEIGRGGLSTDKDHNHG